MTTANGTLASKMQALFDEEIVAKDAEIAALRAKLQAIQDILSSGAPPPKIPWVGSSGVEVVVVPNAQVAQKPAADDPDIPRINAPMPGRSVIGADLIDLTGNDDAAKILTDWTNGNTSAPSRMHDFLQGIGCESEAKVMVEKDGSGDASMVACHALVNEAVFFCRQGNGTPQMVKDRLVRLFGSF